MDRKPLGLVLRYCQQFITPEHFQADERAAEEERPATAPRTAPEPRTSRPAVPEGEPLAKRPRLATPPISPSLTNPFQRTQYRWEHFLSTAHPTQDVYKYYKKYPCLSKRNFYVIQNHHATAKHFDLRLQLDGATVSFAIPKGVSGMTRYKSEEEKTKDRAKGKGKGKEKERKNEPLYRLVVETDPHPIGYTLFEGSSGRFGTTGVWDLGTYKIMPTMNEIKRKEARRKEAEEADSDISSDEEEDKGLPEDWKQENLFCEGFYRGSFKPIPPMFGRPGKPMERDDGEGRGFIIELNGERHKGLRLLFSRTSKDWNLKTPKDAQIDPNDPTHGKVKVARWLMSLDSRPGAEGIEDFSLGERSLLTGRTMDELKGVTGRFQRDDFSWMGDLRKTLRLVSSEDFEGIDESDSAQWESWEAGVQNGNGGVTSSHGARAGRANQKLPLSFLEGLAHQKRVSGNPHIAELVLKGNAARKMLMGILPEEEIMQQIFAGDFGTGLESREFGFGMPPVASGSNSGFQVVESQWEGYDPVLWELSGRHETE
ncbi:hypothetical protein T439DRAFT_325970 [Meredithblackwellia eburnea MCA 4105]